MMTDEATPIFKPHCRFHRAADTLDVYVSGERETSEVVNDRLWMYRGLDTGEVVGFRIVGVVALIDGLRAAFGEARADVVAYASQWQLMGESLDAMIYMRWLLSDYSVVIVDANDRLDEFWNSHMESPAGPTDTGTDRGAVGSSEDRLAGKQEPGDSSPIE